MNATEELSQPPRVNPLLLILVAAVIQGWALYGLHLALDNDWLEKQPAVLLALYTLALFVPTTVQLLSEQNGQRLFWPFVAGLAALFAYFGWFHGSIVSEGALANDSFGGIGVAVTMVVLWLMLLPFLASRLARGAWSADYHEFFTTAWRNKLLLAEAALFTIVFWLLLGLWATLFRLLGIDFFQELFREPIFIYPVTALSFGIALYLIGSVERFVGVVLEQILGLFKWLAVIAGLILTLFSIALVFKLPELIASGTRIINAAWLLWLVAVMILLLNAAYRDGSGQRPYPAFVAASLRYVVPAMVLVALVALYSLGVRIAEYGLTTERFWAAIVAVAALVYAGGYSISAFRPGQWMNGMGKVNVGVALGLIAILALAMTPLLSPFRLAANSQYARILDGRQSEPAATDEGRSQVNDSYRVLRFGMGRYGRERLQQLAELQDHPDAEEIRGRASAALEMTEYWAQPALPFDAEALRVFPEGRSLDANLEALLSSPGGGERPSLDALPGCRGNDADCTGLFIDLDADGHEEFVLLSPFMGWLYVKEGTEWRRDASAVFNILGGLAPLQESLLAGDVAAEPSRWRDLRIGDQVFPLSTGPRAFSQAVPATSATPGSAGAPGTP